MINLNFRFFITLTLLVILLTSMIFLIYIAYTLSSTEKFEPDVPAKNIAITFTQVGTDAAKYWIDKKFSFVTTLVLNTLAVVLGGLLLWKN